MKEVPRWNSLGACPGNDNPTTEDTEDGRKNPVALRI
jgi:hypothetical protein